jgi:hypothetical protein
MKSLKIAGRKSAAASAAAASASAASRRRREAPIARESAREERGEFNFGGDDVIEEGSERLHDEVERTSNKNGAMSGSFVFAHPTDCLLEGGTDLWGQGRHGSGDLLGGDAQSCRTDSVEAL